MKQFPTASIPFLLGAVLLSTTPIQARDLSFEERVKAQEAIERVYYSHQIGTTKPFAEAVPRALVESKVRAYLGQTAALESTWRTAVTAEALEHELRRITRSSRAPDRLEEVFLALGRDPFLIQECFARPVLVNRLARSFLQSDVRFQGAARSRAEGLRRQLQRNPRWSPRPGGDSQLTDVRIEMEQDAGVPRGNGPPGDRDPGDGVLRWRVGRAEYGRLRARAPRHAGEVGQVIETPESFEVQVLLEASDGFFRVAAYTIKKMSWDDWWSNARQGFNELTVRAVAQSGGSPAIQRPVAPGSSSVDCVPDDTWAGGGLDDVPVPASYVAAVWTGTEMLTWGGEPNSAARYDPLTDSWSQVSTRNAPSARSLGAVWSGSEMIVWGLAGASDSGRYDPVSDTWKPVSAAGAPPAGQALIWTGATMIVWGGWPGLAGGRYDPVTDTWSPVSTAGAPGPRNPVVAVWSGKEMIVWGGFDGTNYLTSGGRYDPATDTWRPTSTIGAPSPRDGHTSVWAGGLMIVWGGYDGVSNVGTGARYDPGTDTWTPVSSSNGPSARSGHTATPIGSEILVWGGRSGASFDYEDTGARYDPGTDSWTPMTTTNAPAPRSGHSAVWADRLMIVWGGHGPDGSLATGGRYDPGTDSWTPTSTSNRPGMTGGHSAVWTGSLMILWGGVGPGVNTSASGARFDPVTTTWTPTSTLSAPFPRSGHVAVWTGARMVVWGGNTGEDGRGTGGRYDPITDAWSPTSLTGAPSWRIFRVGASAIWTGTSVIVWGGVDTGEVFLGSGGRYDPESDTWSPTSPINAPPPRAYHSAVWTGSAMLLWGGFVRPVAPDTWLGDGYAYLPASDTWMPLGGSGAPSPRERHTAVWTGRQMLVWGGDGPDPTYGSVYLTDGAAYDPGADAWEPIAAAGAPAQLHEHTAVWDGQDMIVWGYPGSPSTGVGGRYDATLKTWKPVSQDGAPFLQSGYGQFVAPVAHTAVWTGGEMIVWGGGVSLGGAYRVDQSTDADADGFTVCAGDCDDANPAIHPGATESCDGRDDNCDGQVDEGFGIGTSCVRDIDACHQVSGALACSADGTEAQCVGQVGVVDTTPPTITAGAQPPVLWPPNHRMVEVTESVAASDQCSVPTVTLTSVRSLEPDDAPGDQDGETTDDIQGADLGTADFAFTLRAERSGDGAGRAYEVTYSAVDGSGNRSSVTSIVFVPHDEGGATEPLMLSVENPAEGTWLGWDAVAGALSYRAIRGSVGALRNAGDFIDLGTVTCVQPPSTATDTRAHADAAAPPLGEAFFYLVAYNDGQDSGFGTVSAPKPRIVTGGGCEQDARQSSRWTVAGEKAGTQTAMYSAPPASGVL